MKRRLGLLLAVCLASPTLAASCGGGDDNGGGGDGGGSSGQTTTQGKAQCKQTVDQAQRLSSGVRKDLKEICEEAGEGDEDAVRKASIDVCVKIVEQSVPAGPARDQAKDACKQGGSR